MESLGSYMKHVMPGNYFSIAWVTFVFDVMMVTHVMPYTSSLDFFHIQYCQKTTYWGRYDDIHFQFAKSFLISIYYFLVSDEVLRY